VAPVDPALNPGAADAPGGSDLAVLAGWAPELAETFVELACDIALVLDERGQVLRQVQHHDRPLLPSGFEGRLWADVVCADSRLKAEAMVDDLRQGGHARRREINHVNAQGVCVPLSFSAVRLGASGPMLAIGQDQRAQASLQQRFVAAQQALERSYWHAEGEARAAAAVPRPGATVPASTAAATAATAAGSASGATGATAAETLADDVQLTQALAQLVDRIGHEEIASLLRGARELAERHFMARAAQRLGGHDRSLAAGALSATGTRTTASKAAAERKRGSPRKLGAARHRKPRP
jgi:hypothetical protein